MLQHFIILHLLYYLSSGRLWELKNKTKGNFKTLDPKTGRARLREVVAYKMF